VYYWLGNASSTDEKGTAAIKTVELDSYLEGKCTHHREVSGHESSEFLKVLRNASTVGGVKYLEGGHASGFTKARVTARDKDGKPMAPRDAKSAEMSIKGQPATLIRTKATGPAAKGKEFVEISHGKLDPEVLLSKAVYLIDATNHIFVWIGRTANANEQDSALIYAEKYIRSRPGGDTIPCTTVRQRYETSLFVDLFNGYKDYTPGTDTTVTFTLRDHIEVYPNPNPSPKPDRNLDL